MFAVPGELRPDLDVRTVAPDGVQPIVGSEWAIGYRCSYRETAMWDRGTPVILVSFAPSPVERGVQRAWSAFCAAR